MNTTTIYNWKKSDCELCKKPLPKHIRYKNRINDIIDVELPQNKPYIMLESIAKEKKVVKTLFIFTAIGEETEIKLVKHVYFDLKTLFNIYFAKGKSTRMLS